MLKINIMLRELTVHEPHPCPSCGHPDLDEPPRRSPTSGGQYEICSPSGFELGVTDDDLGYAYESLRERRIARTMRRQRADVESPLEGCDAAAQLRAVENG